MNAHTGFVTLVAAAALTLVGTSGTALAGEGHGRDRGNDRREVRGGGPYGEGFHGNRREEHCRPQPPACRPVARSEPQREEHHRGRNARYHRGGRFVIVFNSGRGRR